MGITTRVDVYQTCNGNGVEFRTGDKGHEKRGGKEIQSIGEWAGVCRAFLLRERQDERT